MTIAQLKIISVFKKRPKELAAAFNASGEDGAAGRVANVVEIAEQRAPGM